LILIGLAVPAGLLRQFAPHGIKWNGRWPTSSTSAEDAYKMMARPDDPGFISLAEVIDLQQKGAATLIDARSTEEFKAGRIPGSRTLPYYELEKYQAAALDRLAADSAIIIYCEGIGCELSFFLGRELQAAGYSNIKIFYGGYPEWQQAGLPIEK
jgi:rhodanese-related sulfurtransferase